MTSQRDVQQLIQSLTPSAVNNGNPNTVYNQTPPEGGYIPPTFDPGTNTWRINKAPPPPSTDWKAMAMSQPLPAPGWNFGPPTGGPLPPVQGGVLPPITVNPGLPPAAVRPPSSGGGGEGGAWGGAWNSGNVGGDDLMLRSLVLQQNQANKTSSPTVGSTQTLDWDSILAIPTMPPGSAGIPGRGGSWGSVLALPSAAGGTGGFLPGYSGTAMSTPWGGSMMGNTVSPFTPSAFAGIAPPSGMAGLTSPSAGTAPTQGGFWSSSLGKALSHPATQAFVGAVNPAAGALLSTVSGLTGGTGGTGGSASWWDRIKSLFKAK